MKFELNVTSIGEIYTLCCYRWCFYQDKLSYNFYQ